MGTTRPGVGVTISPSPSEAVPAHSLCISLQQLISYQIFPSQSTRACSLHAVALCRRVVLAAGAKLKTASVTAVGSTTGPSDLDTFGHTAWRGSCDISVANLSATLLPPD